MKAKLLQIHWHERQPIYSLDFDKTGRLATAGGDNTIRLWKIEHAGYPASESTGTDAPVPLIPSSLNVIYIATLKRHLKAVNCVKFHPSDSILASGGDGGIVILWKLVTNLDELKDSALVSQFGEENSPSQDEVSDLESWIPMSLHRVSDNEDIYDIHWSPNGQFLIVGLTDNTAVIWDMKQGKFSRSLKDHRHFVQGVAWDPLEECIATQSSDRTVKVFQYKFNKHQNLITRCLQTFAKYPINETTDNPSVSNTAGDLEMRQSFKKLYYDETLVSFFRRLSFTPEGSLLMTPAGLELRKQRDLKGSQNCVHVYSRASILSTLPALPLISIGPFEKPAIVVRPHHKLFRIPSPINTSCPPWLNLPYRMIFAIATQDAVYLYDTTQQTPFALLKDLHYATLTDLAWSPNGRQLIISSSDGYCSIVAFEENELGITMSEEEQTTILEGQKTKKTPASSNSIYEDSHSICPEYSIPAVSDTESLLATTPIANISENSDSIEIQEISLEQNSLNAVCLQPNIREHCMEPI